ncbi:uncharacterized protein J3R85_001292 [Psidium guajava]|nr:uncharacterized protein J3R85_001292 [Psidium guajava]
MPKASFSKSKELTCMLDWPEDSVEHVTMTCRFLAPTEEEIGSTVFHPSQRKRRSVETFRNMFGWFWTQKKVYEICKDEVRPAELDLTKLEEAHLFQGFKGKLIVLGFLLGGDEANRGVGIAQHNLNHQ